MLPNVLQPNETDHVPVLAEEVRELLAIQPGRDRRRRHLRRRRPRRGARGRPQGRRPLHRDRPRPDRAAVLRGLPAPRRRPVALPARRGLGRPRPAGRERRPRRRDPARPRRLEHADRPARARLLVRGRRAARHAHGPDGGALGGRPRQRGARARARHDLPPLRRGALREADRARDRAPPQEAADRAHRRARRDHPRRDSRLRRASARGIPRSASSRLCGSRSTTSSASSRRPCRPPSRCCGPTDGSR